MSKLELKIPPAVLAVAALALMWGTREVFPQLTTGFPGSRLLAALVCVVGLAIGFGGVVQFRRARTSVNPHRVRKASSVVSTGLYAYTRNPMYLGIVLCLVGAAIYLSNVSTIIGIPAFVLYMNRFQIEPEERALTELFGTSYSAYRDSVRRWI
jgi:protein-S-isoprenylcysteine O-methyltransferase Ste14